MRYDTDTEKAQVYAAAKTLQALSGIQWGNVTLRFEKGKFTGLIEERQTFQFPVMEAEEAARRYK